MNNDNYFIEAAPQDQIVNGRTVSHKILTDIRHGWIAGIAYGALSAVSVIFVAEDLLPMAIGFVFVALLFVLAFGVYKRNRWCAVFLFLCPIAAVLVSGWNPDPQAAAHTQHVPAPAFGWMMPAVFLYFLGKGIRGTFKFHRVMQ